MKELLLGLLIFIPPYLSAQSYRNFNGTIRSIFDKKPAANVTVTMRSTNKKQKS